MIDCTLIRSTALAAVPSRVFCRMRLQLIAIRYPAIDPRVPTRRLRFSEAFRASNPPADGFDRGDGTGSPGQLPETKLISSCPAIAALGASNMHPSYSALKCSIIVGPSTLVIYALAFRKPLLCAHPSGTASSSVVIINTLF